MRAAWYERTGVARDVLVVGESSDARDRWESSGD